jgi:RimJ/RimL family protein N-acetyltransferase
MIIEPVTFAGRWVRLEPLRAEHADALWAAAQDDAEEIFRWYTVRMASADDLRAWVDAALQEQQAGTSLPFVILDRRSQRVVGSTRFMNIDRTHRRVEIGNTWIAPGWQRTGINTEAKLLMLRHAFRVWGCIRLELKTDALNTRSRQAILRLGAREEGTFRKHFVTHSGRIRDSVYFSILDEEWPQIEGRLASRLASYPLPE